MKKKILIVTRAFWPQISPRSFRATELTKEFALQGHNVTILTPRNNVEHDDFEKRHGVSIIDLGRFSWQQMPKANTKLGSIVVRSVNRFMKLAFDYPDIQMLWKVKKALKYQSGYDLLISIAAPHPVHWGVSWAWRRDHPIAKTWIADCGDPYMGSANDTFRKLPYFALFEKSFMRKADFITVPLDNAKDGYYIEFHKKIRTIPQGFKINAVQLSEYQPNRVPHFAYAGAFSIGLRNPRPFLDFLCDQDRDFKFFIFSNNIEMIRDYEHQLDGRLILSGYIPRGELLQRLSQMEFLVNLENNNSVIQSPSKLIDYHIADRPVLSIGKEFDEQTVLEFLNGDYAHARPFEDFDQYRIEKVVEQFLKLSNV